MTHRVIQWGSGAVGLNALRYVLATPSLQLVGLKCVTDAKEGRDAGEIAGSAATGVCATKNTEDLLALKADCVLFMPKDALLDPTLPDSPSRAWVDDVVPILASGKNVVSPIASAMHWRHLADGKGLRDELDKACAEGNSSIFFTGIDPGFVSDCLAITMSSLVGDIEQINTWEVIDYSTYPAFSIEALGFGQRPEDLPATGGAALRASWGCAPYLIADALGVELDDLALDMDFWLAPEAYTAANGIRVEQGTIAALHWSLTGIVDGDARLVVNHINRLGTDTAPEWPRIGTDGGYRIEIDGFPPFRGEFPLAQAGGTGTSLEDAVAMTAARCVNSIDTVVRAKAGYLTLNDLPTIGARHGLRRSRTS
jgi:hypothetical protein